MLKIIGILALLNALILLIALWRFRKANNSVSYDYSDSNRNIDRIFMDELRKQNQELRFAIWDILKRFENGDQIRRNSMGRIYHFRKKKNGGWLVKPIEDYPDLYAEYVNHFMDSSVFS